MASIEIVQSTGYLAFLEPVKESVECYTHLGLIHSTVNGTYSGYIKFYPDELGGSKGLVNEACGYLLAKVLNIPVPRYAMILIVERERLIEAHRGRQKILAVEPSWATWVTEQAKGVPISFHDEKTLDTLRKWDHLPALIAFDDWVLNSDRSLANLVRGAKGHFTAIDHGHIFGGLRWDRDLLTTDLPFRHPLLVELWGGNPPLAVKSRILDAAQKHQSNFLKIKVDLEDMLENLLDNEADKYQLMSFLEHRANQSYDRLKESLGVLI